MALSWLVSQRVQSLRQQSPHVCKRTVLVLSGGPAGQDTPQVFPKQAVALQELRSPPGQLLLCPSALARPHERGRAAANAGTGGVACCRLCHFSLLSHQLPGSFFRQTGHSCAGPRACHLQKEGSSVIRAQRGPEPLLRPPQRAALLPAEAVEARTSGRTRSKGTGSRGEGQFKP